MHSTCKIILVHHRTRVEEGTVPWAADVEEPCKEVPASKAVQNTGRPPGCSNLPAPATSPCMTSAATQVSVSCWAHTRLAQRNCGSCWGKYHQSLRPVIGDATGWQPTETCALSTCATSGTCQENIVLPAAAPCQRLPRRYVCQVCRQHRCTWLLHRPLPHRQGSIEHYRWPHILQLRICNICTDASKQLACDIARLPLQVTAAAAAAVECCCKVGDVLPCA
ncbi:hypothetical protein COO60DRAFT_454458 [Scenedesmus sp. NREL 46B-D3]|nr:hypothetical protein COO60DRAFT_454458 [Scenedesmus sp. NREL 46B-D3]